MVALPSHLIAWEDSVLRKLEKYLKSILKHLTFSNTFTFSILFNEHVLSTNSVQNCGGHSAYSRNDGNSCLRRVSNLMERYTNKQRSKQVEIDVIK